MSRHVLILIAIIATSSVAFADTREDRARALWEEGAARYDVGKFDEAIQLFMRAYELTPEPDILFNLCQGYRQARNYERAIFFCKSFLRNKPAAPNRAVVEELILEMEEIEARQKATGEKPPEGIERPGSKGLLGPGTDPRDEVTPWYADRWGWGTAGTGLAVAGIGAGFLLWSDSLRKDAEQAPDMRDALRLDDEAATKATIGAVVAVAGAATVLGGVFLLAWNPTPSRVERVVTLGYMWIGMEGRF